MTELKQLALRDLHLALGAKMVPFAGYDMPVQYPAGVLKEHLQVRQSAGLFDVSHMGQVLLRPRGTWDQMALALEGLIPVDVLSLPVGRQRYGLFTNPAGGILDDLMFANRGDDILVVVNAACKAADIAHMTAHLSACDVIPVTDRGLLALQGPLAEAALARLLPGAAQMRFMDAQTLTWHSDAGPVPLWISRSGYTGEDGFEISVPESALRPFAERLLEQPEVMPIGLGARDSLRLEAGLPLYGHDIDTTTTPVEAGLAWAIQKSRRSGGDRAGGYPGADRIEQDLTTAPARRRVGLRPDGRAPMREGTRLFADGQPVGTITSGGYGPSVAAPVAMGYVATTHATTGTVLMADLRGKMLPVTVAPMPLHPTTYKR